MQITRVEMIGWNPLTYHYWHKRRLYFSQQQIVPIDILKNARKEKKSQRKT